MGSFNRWAMAVLAISALSSAAHAMDTQEMVMERLRVKANVQPLGPTPFGESINLYTGELSFAQTDIEYSGTGPTIKLGRLWNMQRRFRQGYPFMANWVFDLPRIEAIVGGAATEGLWVTTSSTGTARCTQLNEPFSIGFMQELWFFGYDLITPGMKQTLRKASNGLPKPTMTLGATPVTFTGATESGWRIGCLAATSNGQAGEGFLAVDPEGNKYFLDYLISKPTDFVPEWDGGVLIRHRIKLAAMLVSRIEDRFGNYLTFTYSGSRLQEISASDGRRVSVAWKPVADDVVESITIQPGGSRPRTTTYEYNGDFTFLTGVVRPDGSRWNLASMTGQNNGLFTSTSCGNNRVYNPATPGNFPVLTQTLIHPSGLVGRFNLQNTYHGRYFPLDTCVFNPSAYEDPHPSFATQSITAKEFSGPGVPTRTWHYFYSPAQSATSLDACHASGTCPETAYVDVTAPDGVRTRHTFSTRWSELEGKQLRQDTFPVGSSTPIETTVFAYAPSNAGPYPISVGGAMFRTHDFLEGAIVPLRAKTTTRGGTDFTWSVATGCGTGPYCFDTFARPTKVVKSSSP